MHELSSEFPNTHHVTIGEGSALPAAFEQAVLLHHARPALGASRWEPTYGELNVAANRLAHALLRRCGTSEGQVAILMQHDTPAIAAVLAVLKAGKIAAALNPTHPPARLRQLMEDIEPALIITDNVHLNLAFELAGPACAVIRFEDESGQGPNHNPSLAIGADQTACLVYTSGSTGRPKGVMKTHRQLMHSAYVQTDAMGYTAHDRIPLFGSLGSGQGINLMWGALLNGAQLCPFPMIDVGVIGLRAWMIDQQITVYLSSASIFRHFAKTLDDGVTFPLVHVVRLSSESVTSDDFKLFQKHFSHGCVFVHALSSSETSIIAVWRSSAGDNNAPEGRLPVGTLSSGTEILILDETGRRVGRGEIGEIVVKSRYVAAGYWRQAVLTAERFSGTLGSIRQFRTGDIGRINAKGQLEFVGRQDARLKIRGNRIDLSEVEVALTRLPGVKHAVVDAMDRENKEPMLVCYIVTDDGHSWSAARLRSELRSLVPHYMVPSKFLLLDSLPLTSSGKIDREKLRQIDPSLERDNDDRVADLIVFAGRKGATCKIRGQRVDLTEVERGLSGLPGVGDVAAVAAPRLNGDACLVAYVVSRPGLTSRRLRTAARALMGGHLVPSFFVFIETLPRLANGEVDRTQLRERARSLLLDGTSSLPATETEALMVRIWAEALDLDGVGRMEDFFELGGDSLVATVIAAQLHDMMRVDLDFGAFIEFPILKDFAAFVDETRPNANALSLSCLKPNERAPLSVVQEYYWRRSLDPIRSIGLTRAAAGRIEGPLDINVLRQSINDIAARHDILRTRFEAGQRPDDNPTQSVQPPGDVPLPFVDLLERGDAETHVEAMLNEERMRHFDLSSAPPVSFKLLRLRSDCHVLLRSAHHIVTDGPSWNIFLQDLAHIYDARLRGKDPSLLPLPIRYADYSAWERERWRRGGEPLHQAAAWWRRELEEVSRPPASEWLAAYKRREPAGKLSPNDWSIPWGLESDTSERLDRLGRLLNATYFAVRLAGVVPVCAMAIDQDNVLLAAVRTTRTRAELQPIFGPFINYALLPMRCDWNWTFRDLVAYTRQKLVGVQRNTEVPYSLLLEELNAQGIEDPRPLLLVHRKTPMAPVRFSDLKLTWSGQHWHPMRPGIMVRFNESQECDGCLSVFDARVYSTELMREFVDCLAGFIRAAARDPDASVRSLIEADGIGDRLRKRRILIGA
jgi:amino acid adenylation domain-containing protein